MNRTTGIFVAMLAAAGLAVAVFFLIGPLGDPVYATPQEVFDASVRASEKRDTRAWCQCLTDEARDFFAADTVFQLSGKMLLDQMERKDGGTLEKVFEKHGLKQEFLLKIQGVAKFWSDRQAAYDKKLELARVVLKDVTDPTGLIVDLFKAAGEDPLETWKDGRLTNVKMTGNTAVGTVTSTHQGREAAGAMHFRRQGEGWRIDLFATQKQPGLPGGFQHP